MSHGLNKIMVISHLGRDPEMRYTSNGKPFTSFYIAVNRNWADKTGNKHNQTEWFYVTTWDNLAEFCHQALSKGKQAYVEGRLQTRRWNDTQGNEQLRIEIVASEVIPLGEKSTGGEEPVDSTQTVEDFEEN